jgi:hypothetical protein
MATKIPMSVYDVSGNSFFDYSDNPNFFVGKDLRGS